MATMKGLGTDYLGTISNEKRVASSESRWWQELTWVVVAALVGFANAAVLADWLAISRPWLVLVHALIVFSLFSLYIRWTHMQLTAFVLRNWKRGVLAGVIAGSLLVLAVQREDGASMPEGIRLAWDLLWLGVVYGLADALLLTVLPVLATWRAFAHTQQAQRGLGKVMVGALAVLASLIVTTAYHLGYPEFQGAEIRDPLIGNTITTLSTVLSGSPIASVFSHIAMHIAAVFHGAQGTTQLPPHY